MKKNILFLIIFLNYSFSLFSEEGSIFFVHGFLRSSRCMLPISRALQQEGFRTVRWDYPSRDRTIEEHAASLVVDLQRIAELYPGEPIHFVTHSLGGIIVRAAINHPNCPQEAKIGKAMLLAPPNKGAKMARSLCQYNTFRLIFGAKAGRQLLTYHEQDINQLGHFPNEMEVCVIAGNRGNQLSHLLLKEPNDGKVTVQETLLPTPHKHLTFGVNHTWIMTYKRTIHCAISFFKSDP